MLYLSKSFKKAETDRGTCLGGHLGIFWVGMCRPGLQIGGTPNSFAKHVWSKHRALLQSTFDSVFYSENSSHEWEGGSDTESVNLGMNISSSIFHENIEMSNFYVAASCGHSHYT